MSRAKKEIIAAGPVIEGSADPNAPIMVNLDGLIFLISQEVGVFLQSIERNTSATREDVYDVSKGYDIGFVSYNPQAAWTIKGRVNALNTGMTAAAPGVTVAVANYSGGGIWTGNGVSGGGIYTETVAVSYSEKQFVEISVTALQKPGIA